MINSPEFSFKNLRKGLLISIILKNYGIPSLIIYLKGSNFSEFHEFWANSRKLIPPNVLAMANSQKLILAKNAKYSNFSAKQPTFLKLMTKKKIQKNHFVYMCLLLYRFQTPLQSSFKDLQITHYNVHSYIKQRRKPSNAIVIEKLSYSPQFNCRGVGASISDFRKKSPRFLFSMRV